MKGRFLISAILGLCLASSCDYKPRNQGKSLYAKHCSGCHMNDGEGLGELFPPTANSSYINEKPQALACIIKYGLEGSITVNGTSFNEAMPGNTQLSDVEINNLVHYILEVQNKTKNPYTISDIRAQLSSCN